MSHVATVDLAIKDLKCLSKAAENIGLEFRENQKTYKWYGSWVRDYHGDNAAYKHGIDPKDYGKCEHAIGIPNKPSAYEIGVVKSPEKPDEFTLIWDFFSGGKGLKAVAGDNCGLLCQQYSKEIASKQASQNGWIVQNEKTLQDGSIELTIQA